jgi:Methylamine utilisation protein MauE
VSPDITGTVVPVIEATVGLLFARSSFPKLRDRRSFAASVRGYDLIPLPLVTTFASIVAVSEAGIAVVLLVGSPAPARLFAVGYSIALFIAFSIAVSAAMARGMRIECGCFGDASAEVGRGSFARLLVLIALATGAFVAELFASVPSSGLIALLDPATASFAVMTLISSVGALLLSSCLGAFWDLLVARRRSDSSLVGAA